MGEKEKIISSLAASFGMGDGFVTRYSESRYDSSTGTLYCEGVTIPRQTVQKALDHFTRQKEYYKQISRVDENNMDCYLFNTVACNAIMMLMENVKK